MANKEKTQRCKDAVQYFKEHKDILIQDCAKKFDIHPVTMTRWLKKEGCYEKRANNGFKEIENQFIEFYLKNKDKLGVKECAKKFNITAVTGYEYLRRRNIEPQESIELRKKRVIAQKAACYYRDNALVSIKSVADKFGITPWFAEEAIKKAGIPIRQDRIAYVNGTKYLARSNVKEREARQTYFCNDDYFENIDTAEKAYWLGFIEADGSINKEHHSLTIGLAIRDYDQLHRFKRAINATYPIHEYKAHLNTLDRSYESCSIIITSEKMVSDLMDKNVLPKKTKNEIPPNIDKKWYKDFIRGFFDGDGWICKNRRIERDGAYRWEFGIGSSEKMLQFIHDELEKSTGASLNQPYSFSSIYRLNTVNALDIHRIVKWLYDGAKEYLPRKWERISEFCRSYSILQESADYQDGIKRGSGL